MGACVRYVKRLKGVIRHWHTIDSRAKDNAHIYIDNMPYRGALASPRAIGVLNINKCAKAFLANPEILIDV